MAKLSFAALCAAAALVLGAAAESTKAASDSTAPANPDDVGLTGACRREKVVLCSTVMPGDGRVARCIRDHRARARAQKESDPVTSDCLAELAALFMNISKQASRDAEQMGELMFPTFVNPVAGFREACSKEMEDLCKDVSFMATTSCLKTKKAKLTEACREKLFSVEEEEANDVRLDPELSDNCKTDIARNGTCAVVQPPGAQLACLRANRQTLQDTCQKGLFKRDQADAKDIRLNVDVLNTCKSEISSKCKDVQFGEARILHCLWEATQSPSVDGFDGACQDKVVKLTEQHLRDYRLDFRVRTHCEDDIKAVCAAEKERVDGMTIKALFGSVDDEGLHHMGDSGSVLHCLKRSMDNVKNPKCVKQLANLVRIEAVQFGTDVKLLSACRPSVEQFCSNERRQGIHNCLRKHITELDPKCREHELLQAAIEGRDITMKPQVFFMCTQALNMFCQGVEHAQMLNCLQDHRTEPNFPTKCRQRVFADMEATNHDFRFNHELNVGCKSEIDSFCADVRQEGGGKVTSCLQHHLKNITNMVCRAEVKRFIGEGLEHIYLAPVRHKKCEDDVQRFCGALPPGDGRVNKCLMGHRADLSTACAKSMFKVAEVQSQDITVNHGIYRDCQTSIAKYCKDVPPGEAKVWRCLEDHLNDLPELCKQTVSGHVEAILASFYLNPLLAESCRVTANVLCPAELAEAERRNFASNGTVISCLSEHREKINSTDCKQSLFRKEKQRVKDNMLDPVAKSVCAKDEQTFCADARATGRAQVPKCLQHHLAVLSPPCAKKVEWFVVRATSDIRFDDDLSKACESTAKKFCVGVHPGDGRKMTCLIKNMHKIEVDSSCRDRLVEQEMWRAKGLQFNPALKRTCMQDLLDLLKGNKCDKNHQTEGWKINCLTANKGKMKNSDCEHGVSDMLKMQSADARMKPGLMDACAADIKKLCPGVSPGGGRIHHCLREHNHDIMDARCDALVKEVEVVDKSSATLNYNIRQNCVHERAEFCQGVKAGDSRVLACLAANMSPHFSASCRETLKQVDLTAALKKNPTRSSIEEMKNFIMAHRSFVEKNSAIFVAGTASSICICVIFLYTFVRQRLIVSGSGWYSTVVPNDIESVCEKS